METNSSEAIAELCSRVEEALKNLPGPDRTSREAFFHPYSLWKMELPATCGQVIEYMRSIILLLNQGLNRPAMALSRSIHECYIRFEYLLDREDELRDWFEWQISRDYHSCCDRLSYDTGLPEEDKQGLWTDKKIMEELLGKVPAKRADQWKSTMTMLKVISRNLPAGADLQMRRHLIAYPSDYVHLRTSSIPSIGQIIGISVISFSEILRKAVKLCTDRRMIDLPVGDIEGLCRRVRSDTAPKG